MNKQKVKKIILNNFTGKKITKIIAGGSNGSIVIVRIGDNEFSLFIYCIWRLKEKDKIITGWNESCDSESGNLSKQIKLLLDKEIKNIDLSDFMDMKIHFVGGKVFNIFCDITPKYEPDDYDENWVKSDIENNKSYRLKNNFKIKVSSYK